MPHIIWQYHNEKSCFLDLWVWGLLLLLFLLVYPTIVFVYLIDTHTHKQIYCLITWKQLEKQNSLIIPPNRDQNCKSVDVVQRTIELVLSYWFKFIFFGNYYTKSIFHPRLSDVLAVLFLLRANNDMHIVTLFIRFCELVYFQFQYHSHFLACVQLMAEYVKILILCDISW